MPTPSDYSLLLPSITDLLSVQHTCPPELLRPESPQTSLDHGEQEYSQDESAPRRTISGTDSDALGVMDDTESDESVEKPTDTDLEQTNENRQGLMNISMVVKESERCPTPTFSIAPMSSSTDDRFSRIRVSRSLNLCRITIN